jgi:signal transduction histidine kinase/ActR/RegA family two-component response regulator
MSILTDLQVLGILDGPEEPEFDSLTRLARKTLGARVALFTVIDEPNQRQFFKSSNGVTEAWAEKRETPLTHSISKFVKEDGQPIMVSDTRLDPRLAGTNTPSEPDAIAYLGVPISDENNIVIGALCVIDSEPRDWTEDELDELLVLGGAISSQIQLRMALKRAETARDAAEASAKSLIEKDIRFNDLARNLPGAIYRYILRADGRDEVEYMSPGCLDIWEISAEDIEKDPAKLWSVVDADDLIGLKTSIQSSADNMLRWEHRWRITTVSEKQKWLHGFGTPRRDNDGSIIWNAMVLDVTTEVTSQHKLSENMSRLHNAQKQESIGRIAGGIAHDFNNLMAIVLGNTELLISGEAAKEAPTFLDEIRKVAIRGGELTQRLLSFARRSELVPEVLSVNQAVIDMNDLLRRTIPQNVEIKTTLMAGLWQCNTDKNYLDSALLNLVINARDAMPNGGMLTIETANVRINEDYIDERNEDMKAGRYVMLAITDTGTGIEAGVLPQVFDPFFTTKPVDQGTGLGLSMVHGFAKQSGGTVRVYSEVGVGTSVKLYLNAHEGLDHFLSSKPMPLPDEKMSGNILLVEDEGDLLRIIRIFLESAGFSVTSATSGDEAYEIFVRDTDIFDLIVTDIIMPGQLQGPMLVKKIREIRDDLSVVYVSGYPHEANVHGNGIRPNDISLTKPLERNTFISAVQKAVSKANLQKAKG